MQTDTTPKPMTTTTRGSTQAFGLGLISVALVAVLAITFLMFDGDDAGMFGVLAIAAVGATFLVRSSGKRWAKAVGLVVSILSLAVFFLGFGILHLFSPVEFIVGLVYVFGVILSLLGGVKGIARGGSAGGSGRLQRSVLAVIGLLAVVSTVGYFATRETVAADIASGSTLVDMSQFEFVPAAATVDADGTLLVRNSDLFVHDFTSDALNIAVVVGPGNETSIDLSGVEPGTYEYICTLHHDGTSGMGGQITVNS